MKRFAIPALLAFIGLLLVGFSLFSKGNNQGDLDLEIVKTETIMPAAHLVYANEDALDGKYYLFKAKLTNGTKRTLEDVTVRYRIPGYVEWTELDVIGEMFPGQTAAIRCYPKFKDNIVEKMTESTEKAEIEVVWDGISEDEIVEEEFAFKISGRKEYKFTNIPAEEIAGWADVYNNDELLACFVTPNDPIVQYYTQNIQEKILKGESASVSKDPKEAVRFLIGIYNATLLSHMVYSGTKMIPESIQDVSKFSQENRLPREVITGNTGLCLELSLLYASILSNAGIDPIIFLVPGHAYPGFKMGGQFFAIEATGIGGEGLGSITSAEDAFAAGQKQLEEFMQRAQQGDPRYTLVDIHEVNQRGGVPMALTDDSFLRKKVDDIVASWNGGAQPASESQFLTSNSGTSWSAATTADGSSVRTTSSLSFVPPTGWQTVMKPLPQLPILTAQVLSPDQSVSVSVYDVPTSNRGEAMYAISQALGNYGMQLDYQINGTHVVGNTYSSNGTFSWMGKLLSHQGKVRLVAVGTPDYLYQQHSSIIHKVFNSIN
jgi:hypothetical protein